MKGIATGWRAEGTRARVWRALLEAGGDGRNNAELMACGLGLGRKAMAITLNQIKALGFVTLESAGTKSNRWRAVPGRMPLINPLVAQPPHADDPFDTTGAPLAAKAGAHLCKHTRGDDSGTLAALLGCTVADIETALAPAVQQGRLMACTTWRNGSALTFYRVSIKGVARHNWRTQAAATWGNARAQATGAAV